MTGTIGVAMTGDSNVAIARVGDLLISASGHLPISDKTWLEYLELAAASVQTSGPFHGLFLWWPTHGPSAKQRSLLTNEYATKVRLDQQRRVAVFASSILARGAMTAISWLLNNANMLRSFSPPEAALAFDWFAENMKFDRHAAENQLAGCVAACGQDPADLHLIDRIAG